MSTKLITAEELAADLNMPVKQLHRLRRSKGWPYVRFTRLDIRFTESQVEEIVAMQSVTAPKEPAAAQTGTLPGQTERSAKRSS